MRVAVAQDEAEPPQRNEGRLTGDDAANQLLHMLLECARTRTLARRLDEAGRFQEVVEHLPRFTSDPLVFLGGEREPLRFDLGEQQLHLHELPDRRLQLLVAGGGEGTLHLRRLAADELRELGSRVAPPVVGRDRTLALPAAEPTVGPRGDLPRHAQRCAGDLDVHVVGQRLQVLELGLLDRTLHEELAERLPLLTDLRLPPLLEEDDVIAEGALDHRADLAHVEREGRVLERLDHAAAAEEAEITAARRAPRVLRVLLRQLLERLPGLRPLAERLGERLDAVTLRLRRVGRHPEQDVACPDLRARPLRRPAPLELRVVEHGIGRDHLLTQHEHQRLLPHRLDEAGQVEGGERRILRDGRAQQRVIHPELGERPRDLWIGRDLGVRGENLRRFLDPQLLTGRPRDHVGMGGHGLIEAAARPAQHEERSRGGAPP